MATTSKRQGPAAPRAEHRPTSLAISMDGEPIFPLLVPCGYNAHILETTVKTLMQLSLLPITTVRIPTMANCTKTFAMYDVIRPSGWRNTTWPRIACFLSTWTLTEPLA